MPFFFFQLILIPPPDMMSTGECITHMSNHFVLPKEQYQRDFDLVDAYIRQNATYIALNAKVPYEEAVEFVKRSISPDGQFPLNNRPVTYLAKDTPANRKLKEGTFLQYLNMIRDKKYVMAPTMTAYFNPKQKKSVLAAYITNNMKLRKKDKHDMFIAELNKQYAVRDFKNVMQNSRKIKNNSLSGAHASTGTVLYCKSIHPTLTSICRSAAGYGNANNEKFLAGNRHYWSSEITIANVLSIITRVDYEQISAVIDKYQIHIPTPQECMDVVLYSSRLYWRHLEEELRILKLFESMSDLQRAAFVYIGDMYHLAKYNDGLVRGFIGALAVPATTPHPEPDAVFKQAGDDHLALANLLCTDITRGKTRDKLKENDPVGYATVAQTIVKNISVLDQYQDMIYALWATNNVPASVYNFPGAIRRVAVVSDTDSTIFTNQLWTQWFVGKLDFSPESLRVSYVTTFLTSQVVIHLLAIMSANMYVDKDNLHDLAMKNEYFFPVFGTTSMSKHYFAYMSAREGNVYEKMKLEIKGKNLRDSTLPRYIREGVRKYVSTIMDLIMKDGRVSIHDVLRPVAEIESNIINNVRQGGYSDMPSVSIKELSVYTDPINNPYFYHRMWETVFAPKYGNVEAPPYKGVKITVDLNNPTKFKRWLAQLPDQMLAQRLADFMKEYKKDSLGMFVLPEMIASQRGIPDEMISAVNLRKLVYGTTFPFYMLLEALGVHITGSNLSRLVVDIYPIDGVKTEIPVI